MSKIERTGPAGMFHDGGKKKISLVQQAERRYSSLTDIMRDYDNIEHLKTNGCFIEELKRNDSSLSYPLREFLGRIGTHEPVMVMPSGTGRIGSFLRMFGKFNTWGIDYCQQSVDYALKADELFHEEAKSHEHLPVVNRAHYSVKDILEYSSDKKYRIVIVADLLMYFTPNQQETAMRNINRLMTHKGQLFLRIYSGHNEFDLKEKVLDLKSKTLNHYWTFRPNKEYLIELLQAAGFRVDLIRHENEEVNSGTHDSRKQKFFVVHATKIKEA